MHLSSTVPANLGWRGFLDRLVFECLVSSQMELRLFENLLQGVDNVLFCSDNTQKLIPHGNEVLCFEGHLAIHPVDLHDPALPLLDELVVHPAELLPQVCVLLLDLLEGGDHAACTLAGYVLELALHSVLDLPPEIQLLLGVGHHGLVQLQTQLLDELVLLEELGLQRLVLGPQPLVVDQQLLRERAGHGGQRRVHTQP